MIRDPKKYLSGLNCLLDIVPILPLNHQNLGLQKMEIAIYFVSVPYCSAKELREGSILRMLLDLGAPPAPGSIHRGEKTCLRKYGWLSNASLDLHLDLHFGPPLIAGG